MTDMPEVVAAVVVMMLPGFGWDEVIGGLLSCSTTSLWNTIGSATELRGTRYYSTAYYSKWNLRPGGKRELSRDQIGIGSHTMNKSRIQSDKKVALRKRAFLWIPVGVMNICVAASISWTVISGNGELNRVVFGICCIVLSVSLMVYDYLRVSRRPKYCIDDSGVVVKRPGLDPIRLPWAAFEGMGFRSMGTVRLKLQSSNCDSVLMAEDFENFSEVVEMVIFNVPRHIEIVEFIPNGDVGRVAIDALERRGMECPNYS